MAEPHIRPMRADEFADYRRRTITEYAAEHVRVGSWTEEEAEQRAAKQTDDVLPDGVATEGQALLVAEVDGEAVGLVWVGPAPGGRAGWWIYDIEVIAAQRRRGYGRALLEAAEREVRRRGGEAIGLNVFGGNDAARQLYEASGYELTSFQMRKRLEP
jgi:ribosomal protein S18 acetylase RimI-like enzyme